MERFERLKLVSDGLVAILNEGGKMLKIMTIDDRQLEIVVTVTPMRGFALHWPPMHVNEMEGRNKEIERTMCYMFPDGVAAKIESYLMDDCDASTDVSIYCEILPDAFHEDYVDIDEYMMLKAKIWRETGKNWTGDCDLEIE